MRWRRLAALAGLMAGFGALVVLDGADRTPADLAVGEQGTVPVVAAGRETWFCPGGSGSDGPAVLGLEVAAVGGSEVRATVRLLDSGSDGAPETGELVVPGGSRVPVAAADLVRADWVAAVVRVDGGPALVSQTVAGETGVDRSPCTVLTATTWTLARGSTRTESHGERAVVLLSNPFPDDAVVDVDLVSEFGVDAVPALVVPAGRVVALDLASEVPAAAAVSAVVRVTAGRVVAGRVQTADGPDRRGLAAGPLVPGSARVWSIPDARWTDGRRDVLAVTNPSADLVAEVDVEILPDDPEAIAEPFELSIRPGRTVVLDLASEDRLVDAGPGALLVRSLGGVGIAVQVDVVGGPEVGAGLSTGAASDLAGRRWSLVVPSGQEAAGLVVANPSAQAEAPVRVLVDGREMSSFELGPGRRSVVDLVAAGVDGGIVVVEADAGVVVGWDTAGSSSLAAGIAAVGADSALSVADLP